MSVYYKVLKSSTQQQAEEDCGDKTSAHTVMKTLAPCQKEREKDVFSLI
jgi:hypothetical protein